MFMINRVGKLFLGDDSKRSLVEVPDGQLYLVRPHSVKGSTELIFKDATASIRGTTTNFQHQLVITRVFEEGEEELEDDDEDASEEEAFLLDEALHFRAETRESGEKVFTWRDLDSVNGDLWEFVCDTATKPETVQAFMTLALRCQFERKYQKSGDMATAAQLGEFLFTEDPTPPSSPGSSNTKSPELETMPSASAPIPKENKKATVPEPPKDPQSRETMAREVAELHLWDPDTETFVLQDSAVEAVVLDLGAWKYWLKVRGNKRGWVGRHVEENLNPFYNYDHLSFIFNVYGDDSAYSYLLRFKGQPELQNFHQGVSQALWEHSHQMKWAKLKESDQDYVLDAFRDLTMEDAAEDEEEEEEEDESDEESYAQSDEHSERFAKKDGQVNSQLAVGNDRSYVVRGSQIGVFKHSEQDHHLEFVTNISEVKTLKGKLFSPQKVMLYAGGRQMILKDSANPNSVYAMDIDRGTVVDEYKIGDDMPIISFNTQTKHHHANADPSFMGVSHNAIYQVDPRLSGNKLAASSLQKYATKTAFTTAATTDVGYIAVGSEKGDIRLFDRLGIRAKTQLPALGEPIIGVDVSGDGHWVLATTKTYLLLIDVAHKETGKSGFQRAFPKDAKPQPRRLALTPSHAAQFQHETGRPISFTPAKFNAKEGESGAETMIVTATGPFVVTWSMKKILKGQKDPYSIKRYTDDIKADNFRPGTDEGIVLALPNEVDMVMRKALRRPTRESIAPVRLSAGRGRKSRGFLREEIVESVS